MDTNNIYWILQRYFFLAHVLDDTEFCIYLVLDTAADSELSLGVWLD